MAATIRTNIAPSARDLTIIDPTQARANQHLAPPVRSRTSARRPPFNVGKAGLVTPRPVCLDADYEDGLLEIAGSDAVVGGDAWTRFWINGLFSVVNQSGTADLARSALSRSAMEAVWAPASLLPQNGVKWRQTGPDTAKLTFSTGIEPVYILLDEKGSVREIRTMRWSNANPSATFRLQPFGGTMQSENTFGGYTIPTRMQVGNQFGTADYLPFFQAEIRAADYLPI